MTSNLFKNGDTSEVFAAGTTIFSEGDDPGETMYVVQEGEVDIVIRNKLIDTIGPGEFLGEIGLVDRAPRSATAIARVDCKLDRISAKRFQFLVQQTPFFALQVMQSMAKRLRAGREQN